MKKDEELLARQVERDQLVRGGDGGDGLREEEGWLWFEKMKIIPKICSFKNYCLIVSNIILMYTDIL